MSNSREMKWMAGRVASTWMALLTVVLAGISVSADDAPPEGDAYQSVWSSLSELLRRREYGSASGLMESVSDDPELQYRAKQTEADKAVVAGLQTLEKVVAEQLSHLPEGTPLDLSGVECTLVRCEQSPKGAGIVLKTKSTGREMTRLITDLPPAVWIKLAEPHLDSLENPDLILAVFAGFDASADAQTARKLFNQAAISGADVTPWLARLDEAEAAKNRRTEEQKTSHVDPLVGHWRAVAKHDRGHGSFNVEYRENGTVVRVVSPMSRRRNARNRGRQPTILSFTGRWQKQDDGSYKTTYSGGQTTKIRVEGDRFWGKTADGTNIFGTRQLTKKDDAGTEGR